MAFQEPTPMEYARSIKRLHEAGMTVSMIAERAVRTQAWVCMTLNFLKLPQRAQDMLDAGTLCKANASRLLQLPEQYQDYYVEAAVRLNPMEFAVLVQSIVKEFRAVERSRRQRDVMCG